MPTYRNKPYTSIRNINLKDGLLRFGKTYATNPLPTDKCGLYVNSGNVLVFSQLGTDKYLTTYSPSASLSPSSSTSPS